MFDPVQAQLDIVGVLESYEALSKVNVKSYRRMRLQQELDWRVLVTRPRAGGCGCGLLVVEPSAAGRQTNVSGPVLNWTFGVVAIEQPDMAFHPTQGAHLSAEQLAMLALDALQLYADDRLGTFSISGEAIKPEREFSFPGCVAYRANFILVGKGYQTQRCKPVTITVDGTPLLNTTVAAGEVALACAEPGATIRYTTDGTFPSRDTGSNPGAQDYTDPFVVVPEDIIRAVAYADDRNNSAARFALVT